MLIEFRVANYRSFREPVTFSMEAADIVSQPPSLDQQNVFQAGEVKLLSSAVIYGANASGKSNLVSALNFMRTLVLSSSRNTQVGEPISVEPFRLSTTTEGEPSRFEIVFLTDEVQYRYGFEVNTKEVVNEWLYRLGSIREIRLFSRTPDAFEVNARSFREGQPLKDLTRANALFLSVVAQFNGQTAKVILDWFRKFAVNRGVDDYGEEMLRAVAQYESSRFSKVIGQLICRLDVGIDRLEIERVPITPPPSTASMPDELAEPMKAFFEALSKLGSTDNVRVRTGHYRYDSEGHALDIVSFDLEDQESAGTRRLFTLAYPLVRALQNGGVLVVDELDARIHSNLAVELIQLFNSQESNPHHAQLIFTTHNTNLLGERLFRRDQVWFVEKSRHGASALYSLAEYRTDGKMERNDASFEKNYLSGRYGAVPFPGDLSDALGADVGQEITEE